MQKFYLFLVFTIPLILSSQSLQLQDLGGNSYAPEHFFCAGETFDLKVDATASSTGNYQMTNEQATNYPFSAGDQPIIFENAGTDKFSQSIPIGFTFSFYGKDYTKVVAGSNGRLVFTNSSELENLKDATTYQDRTFSGIAGYNSFAELPSKDYNKVYRNQPTQELNLAQIFFGYTDLVPKSVNGSVEYLYKNITINGANALLISYQNMIRTNGSGGISSQRFESYILLFEDGRIVINVKNKSESNYNAILGIQNADATKFKVPTHSTSGSDYNNGQWNSENVAWVFTPNQQLTPQYKWYKNSALLSETSNTLSNFEPTDGDIVKVEVTYVEDASLSKSGEVKFKTIPQPVITANSPGGCVSGVTLNIVNDPLLQYEWFKVGDPTVLGTGSTYYGTQTGNYFVRAKRKVNPSSCFVDSAPFAVNLNSTIPAFNVNNKPLEFCDTSSATTMSINLYDYYPSGSNYSVTFSENGTAIPDPANFSIDANTVRNLNVKANDSGSGCSIDHNFTLRFDSLPASVNLNKKYCYGETTIDVSRYLTDVAGANASVFYVLYSNDGINYSTNTIFNVTTPLKIWIKIFPLNNPTSSCFTISTVQLTEDAKVIAERPITQLPPQCASQTQTFDLASLIPEINPGDVTVTFHNSLSEAESGANAVDYNFRSGLGETTLYIRVVDNVTHCVSPDHPDITLLVYRKPKLKKTKVILENCEGSTIFNLSQNTADLTDAAQPVSAYLEYYSESGVLLTPAQVSSYDAATFGLHPKIKVIYNTTCYDWVTFDLNYIPKPVSLVSQILICSETTYSLQNFKSQVVADPMKYSLTDPSGNPLPNNFDVSILPKTIQFIIKDNEKGCLSDVQSVQFVKGTPTVLLASTIDFIKCDTDFDGITEFDLDSKKSEFSTDPNATFDYFKDAACTQQIAGNYTNQTAFAQTIYVKVSVPNFCPAFAKINLKLNVPAKSSTLKDKYFICYGETLSIDAGPENTIYNWSNGQTSQVATFTEAGTYSVTLQNGPDGCPYTHTFTISDDNQPKITLINQTNTSIEVNAEGGNKPYIYLFNGVPQNSNILNNPTASSYTIQVQSASGCLGPPKTVYFIKINNAFTPNADGINDSWKIDNLDKMQQVSIVIVDRMGAKVFESKNPNQTEWDGKSFGRALPTGTYWYVVSWFDAVTQKTEQRQGWILLKNRN